MEPLNTPSLQTDVVDQRCLLEVGIGRLEEMCERGWRGADYFMSIIGGGFNSEPLRLIVEAVGEGLINTARTLRHIAVLFDDCRSQGQESLVETLRNRFDKLRNSKTGLTQATT